MKYSLFVIYLNQLQGKGDSAGGDREGRNRKGGDTSGSNGDSGHGSGSNGERERSGGPRLPQKEKDYYGPQNWAKVTFNLALIFIRIMFQTILKRKYGIY